MNVKAQKSPKNVLLVALILLIFAGNVNAQTNIPGCTVSSITNVELQNMDSATTLIADWEENNVKSSNLPMPFGFKFGNEEDCSSFKVGVDGSITLNYPHSDKVVFEPWHNNKQRTSHGHVKYKLIGEAPNRIMVIEWKTESSVEHSDTSPSEQIVATILKAVESLIAFTDPTEILNHVDNVNQVIDLGSGAVSSLIEGGYAYLPTTYQLLLFETSNLSMMVYGNGITSHTEKALHFDLSGCIIDLLDLLNPLNWVSVSWYGEVSIDPPTHTDFLQAIIFNIKLKETTTYFEANISAHKNFYPYSYFNISPSKTTSGDFTYPDPYAYNTKYFPKKGTAYIMSNSDLSVKNYTTDYHFSKIKGIEPFDMNGAQSIIGSNKNDESKIFLSIPFTFNFGGTIYGKIAASSNGFIGLTNGGFNFASPLNNLSASSTYPIIAPWWDDLNTGNNGSVRYKIFGTSPNRKLVVEWKVRNQSGSGNYDKTLQACITETTNLIYFIYPKPTTAGFNQTTYLSGSSATIGLANSNVELNNVYGFRIPNPDPFLPPTDYFYNRIDSTFNINNVWPGSSSQAFIYNLKPKLKVAIQSISEPWFCAGVENDATVTFTATDSFPIGNKFIVQIQKTGTNSWINIDTLASRGTGVKPITIPPNLIEGHYNVRLKSTITGIRSEEESYSIYYNKTYPRITTQYANQTNSPDTFKMCVSGSLTAGGGDTYLWNDSSTNRILTVNSPGTYIVTITDSRGCSASDTVEVIIIQEPTADAGPTLVDICNGDTTASLAGIAGGGATRWKWRDDRYPTEKGAFYPNDTVLNATYSPQFVHASLSQYPIKLTLKTENDRCGFVEATKYLTVNPNPDISIASLNNGNFDICEGDSITLNGLGSNIKYLWSTADTTETITVSPDSTTYYSIRATIPATGCHSDTVEPVNVISVPTPVISTINGNCVGSATLTVDSLNSPFPINWLKNGNPMATTFPSGVKIAGYASKLNGAAELNRPTGIAFGANGSIYIADERNHRIQKWDQGAASGITIAGGNGAGNAPNQLDFPKGVFVDANGNVFVSDRNNNRVQKFAPGDSIGVTVAGSSNGVSGNTNKLLDDPNGVFVDAIGNIYVSDEDNHRIQKWAPGAINGVTVAGGHGAGSAANQFNKPSGVFVDGNGNIFVSDEDNDRVQKWAPADTIGITVAGGNGQGNANNQLFSPVGVFVDAIGNVYVSDVRNMRVQKWAVGDSLGVTVAGNGSAGSGLDRLYYPNGVLVDGAGNVFVSDFLNNRIVKWSPGANSGVSIAGQDGQATASELNEPTAVFVDPALNLFICDKYNHRIQKWAPGDSTGTTVAGGNGAGAASNQLDNPSDVFVTSNGDLYVSDADNHRVQKWAVGASSGVTVAGGNGAGIVDNQLNHPEGVYVDAAGNIYVADTWNQRIQKWASGATSGINVAGFGYGSGNHELSYPSDVFVDAIGNIYVADRSNDRIQKWAPGANQGVTVAGGKGTGAGLSQLRDPEGIFVDAASNIYVADPFNNRIMKWAPGAIVGITVAGGNFGTGQITQYSTGGDNDNQLRHPEGVHVDASGNIYVADTWNNRIQKWTPSDTSSGNFTPTSAGVYTAVVTGEGGCTDSSNISITIDPLPQISIIGSTVGCDSVTLTAGGGVTYNWSGGNQTSSATNTFTSSGNKKTIVSNNFGCIDSAHQFIIVSPTLTPTLSTLNGNCAESSILTLNGASKAFKIDWQKDGSSVHTTLKQAITIAGGNSSGNDTNQLAYPSGVFVHSNGDVYVCDHNNHRVQKWASGANAGVTVAGGNGAGSALNQLNYPSAVFVDSNNDLYVSDEKNHRIQKWVSGSSAGITVAGGNGAGYSANQLNNPNGLYIDSIGNIFISDRSNSRIQKWDLNATSGTTLTKDVTPGGVYGDNNGNIYVSSSTRVQKWTPGATSGIKVAGGNGAGDGTHQLNNPEGIFVDKGGNLFISDRSNHRVQKWTPGSVNGITVAGGNGLGSNPNQLDNPNAVFVDALGNIYVSDHANSRIQKVSPIIDTTYTPTEAGSYSAIVTANGNCTSVSSPAITINPLPIPITTYDSTNCGSATYTASGGVGYNWSGGNNPNNATNTFTSNDTITVRVTDTLGCVDSSRQVVVIQPTPTPTLTLEKNDCSGATFSISSADKATQIIWQNNGITVDSTLAQNSYSGVTVAGGNGSGSNQNQLNRSNGVFVDAIGNVYISDSWNDRIQKWAPGDTVGTTVAGGNGAGSAANQLDNPSAVFVDYSGNIYVSDEYNHRIQKWAPNATSGTTVVTGGSGYQMGDYPRGIFVDENETMYILYGETVLKWEKGAFSGTVVAGGNGHGSAANQLYIPNAIWVDINKNIYISDYYNNRIQKWAPGASSGITVATCQGPTGVAVDNNFNVYISSISGYNERIQKWAPNATNGVTVASGQGWRGVFVDANQNLYIADDDRIQKWIQGATTIDTSYSTTVSGNYSAIVTYSSGCVDSIAPSINVNIPSLVGSIAGIASGCDSVTLTAQGGVNYTWSGGNSPDSATNTFTSSGTYSVVIENSLSCFDTISQAVTINTTPLATIINPNKSGVFSICSGDSITLVNPSTGVSFLWSTGDTTSQITVSPTSNTTYSVTQTSKIPECVGNVASASQLATVNPIPTINVGDPLPALCNGESTLALGGSFGGGANGAVWNDGGAGGTFSPNDSTLNATYSSVLDSGSVTLTLTSFGGGCGIASATKSLVVNPNPIATITNLGCIGTANTLDGSGSNVSYLWSTGDTTNQITVSPAANTIYTLTQTNKVTGCSSTLNQDVRAFALLSPILTDPLGPCLNTSVLSLSGASAASKIQWLSNGVIVSTVNASYADNGNTVAGGNGSGSALNKLNNPEGLFVDGSGNIYVADYNNHRVQKWALGATSGITVAGGNGPGNALDQLNRPTDVYVDTIGNIYVADRDNHRVQKWAPGASNGITVAGGNGFGSALNQLIRPSGVYVDVFGNVYVADDNDRVQKWAPGAATGITVAGGNGRGSLNNQMDSPKGLFVDVFGNVFVADYNHRVQKWAPGTATGVTVAGNPNGVSGNSANLLNNPSDVFVDAYGNIFVSDGNNNRVQKWAPGAANGITVVGGNGSGSGLSQLGNPKGIFIDANDNIYVADQSNHRIQKWEAPNIDTIFNPTTTGLYTAVVTAQGGCVSSSTDSVSIVDTIMAASITGPQTGCDSITITASGGVNYQWNGGINNSSAANTFTSSGAYTVTVTNNIGCIATAAIPINITPNPGSIVLSSSNGACEVSSLLTLNGASAVSQIIWQNNGVNASIKNATPSTSGITVAGNSTGSSGALSNQLNQTSSAFVDKNGNVYVADGNNHRVQKWVPGDTTGTTVAGGNGQGSALNQLNNPSAVFVDTSGNVYVADQSNHRIQKWAPGATNGITVAGGNGLGSSANQFGGAKDVYVDIVGNIYVADYGNHRVQKWAPGTTSGITVAGGNGQGNTLNKLNYPIGIFVDAIGTVYVCDQFNNRIQKWAPGATSGVKVAGGSLGSGASQLSYPSDVYVDIVGNIYVADGGNDRVQKWAPGATSGVSVAGGNGQGNAPNQLNYAAGVHVDHNGNIYVADYDNHRIQKWNASEIDTVYTPYASGSYSAVVTLGGCTVTSSPSVTIYPRPNATITGNVVGCDSVTLTATGGLNYSWGGGNIPLAASNTFDSSGTYAVLVTNTNGCSVTKSQTIVVNPALNPSLTSSSSNCISNNTVLKLNGSSTADQIHWIKDQTIISTKNKSLTGTTAAGNTNGIAGTNPNSLSYPASTFEDKNGNIYVADLGNARVQKWVPGATSGITVAGASNGVSGTSDSLLDYPWGIFVDDFENVYVTDLNNHRVQKWAPGATSGITVAGSSVGNFGIADSLLNEPSGIYVDSNGNIYVSDTENNRVQKWAPGATSGITVAGRSDGTGGGYDNIVLSDPKGIYLDKSGQLYIADERNHRIQKWIIGDSIGVTVAGGGNAGKAANQLFYPSGVYVDDLDNIYVADSYNNRVQKWAPGATSATTIAGASNGVSGSSANRLKSPSGVFIGNKGTIYITDRENHRIQKWGNPIDTVLSISGIGSYYASVTANGCSSTTDSITISDTASTILVSVSENICIGDSVSLTSSETGTYLWNTGDTTQTITASPATSTTFKVTTTSVTTGCIGTTSQLITVNALPTANIGDSLPAICQGETTIALGGSVGGSAIFGVWDDGGAGGSFNPGTNDLNATYTAALNSDSSVTLTFTTIGGICGTTSGVKTILVNPITIDTITNPINAGVFSTCSGSPITLAGSSANVAYLWSTGDTTNQITVSPTSNTNYALTLTNKSTGCTSTINQAIIIKALPAVSVSGTSTGCDSVTLTASGGINYNWSGGIDSSSATNIFFTSDSYSVLVTDTNGCSALASQFVNVQPSLNTSISTNGTCLGSDIEIMGASFSTKIQWQKNDTVIQTANKVIATSGVTAVTSRADGIFVDKLGSIFISQSNKVSKWASGATLGITVAGGNGSGSALNQLNGAAGIFVDDTGNVFVADENNHRVQKWAPGSSTGVTVAGGNGSGSTSDKLNSPTGVHVDNYGNVYIADRNNHRVQKWAPSATVGTQIAGLNGAGNGNNELYYPNAIFVDNDGNVYVSDEYNHRIQKWEPGATTGVKVAGGSGSGSGNNRLSSPNGVFVDYTGNIYVSDESNHRIQKWAPGTVSGITVAGGNGSGSLANQLYYPNGVFVDNMGNVYVSDPANNRIQKWASSIDTLFTPTASGSYSAIVTSFNGCESSISLIISNSTSKSLSQTSCGSYNWKGKVYSQSGTYLDTIPSTTGCDSIITLNLTVKAPTSKTFSANECESYSWLGKTYTNSGIYYDTIPNAAGCDSIITLDLTIRNATTESFTINECESYTWQGVSLTQSGTYYDTIPNKAGCDSLMVLNLTIRNSSNSIASVDVCGSYDWLGKTILESGIYYDTILNAAGCDSLMTLNLTIRNVTSETFTEDVCDSYTWQGMTFTQSGTYYDTIQNSAGCDSIMILNLIIRNSTNSTASIDACGSYNWMGKTLTQSGTYSDSVANTSGCDSILTLSLTIRNSITIEDTVNACGSYSWLGKTLTQSGNYVDTVQILSGCDSIVWLNLTMLNSSASTDSKIACDSYQWIDGITYTASNDTAAYILTNTAGCDSVVTLNLTIDSTSSFTKNISFQEITGTSFQGVSDGSVAFSDIDNDGDEDVLITGYSSTVYEFGMPTFGFVGMYKNNGTGTFSLDNNSPFNYEFISNSSVGFSDLDNDGDKDLLITGVSINNNFNQYYGTTYKNNGTGSFSYSKFLGEFSEGDIAFSDVDNDGDNDVLITGNNPNGPPTSKLFLNDGTGTFSAATNMPFDGVQYSSIAFSDVDNDGDEDVLITGRNSLSQSIAKMYLNNGSGTFTLNANTPFVGVQHGSIAFSDIDNDGDEDVMITGRNSSNQPIANLYLNNGLGSFTLVTNTTFEGVYNSSIGFSDLDNDGDEDVLITGRNSSNQRISKLYVNDGAGGFSYVSNTPFEGVENSSIAFSDVDNDGKEDVLITGTNSSYQEISKLYKNQSALIDSQFVSCDNFTWIDGNTYTESTNTPTYSLNCGALVTLNLIKTGSSDTTDTTVSVCNSFNWLGTTYTSSVKTSLTLTNTAGCDSVVTLDLTINQSNAWIDTVVTCNNSYTWIDNNTYSQSNNSATHTLANASGCDSIVSLDLTINAPTTWIDTIVTCNSSYTWIDNNVYSQSNNTATHILPNATGCDSVVTLDLTINSPNAWIYTIVTCSSSYTWIDNNVYSQSNNSATVTLTNAANCDSVVTLDLTINQPTSWIDTVVACGSYTWIDNNVYTTSNNTATFTLTNAANCDSVVTLDLTINQPTSWIDTVVACGSFTWIDNNVYTSSNNTATVTLTNAANCDSLVTLDLTINQPTSWIDTVVACGSYTWIDNNVYTSSNNTATFTLTNAANCDSVVTLDLTINQPTSWIDTVVACGSFTWIDNIGYSTSNNTATVTLTNAANCDSVVTLDLTINQPTSWIDTIVACGSYTWIDNNVYTTSNNTASVTLTNAANCDSVVTLDLTINQPTSWIDTVVACGSYTWIDNIVYTTSNNTATVTLTNAANCDSVVTLDLTINQPTSWIDTVFACGSYTWIDNNVYTTSNNTATVTLTNAANCDSVVTLNLTINQPTSWIDTVVACGSYTWIDNNVYTSSNNTATVTLTNAANCDSVVTLDLTINQPTSWNDTVVACNSYTWIDGQTYTVSNNSATFTLQNAVGCDSVVTLDLTINNSNTGIDTIVACNSYTWIDGQTYTSSNNSATVTLKNAANCDSVVTLDLTINQPTSWIDTVVACGSYTWIDNNVYTTSNNTAIVTLTNAAGCDSVVTLDLTNNQPTSWIDTVVACGSYTWTDNNVYTSNNNSATVTLTNAANCDSVVTLNLTISNILTANLTDTICNGDSIMLGGTYISQAGMYSDTLQTLQGCDSVIVTDLSITPGPSITIDTLNNIWCNQVSFLVNSNETGLTYLWSNNETTDQIQVSLTDGLSQSFSVTAMNPAGCMSNMAMVNYNAADFIESYTLLANYFIRLKSDNKVNSGAVGVRNPGGKIIVDNFSGPRSANGFIKADSILVRNSAQYDTLIEGPAMIALPIHNTSTVIPRNFDTVAAQVGAVKVENRKNVHVVANKNSTVTLTNDRYGDITVNRGASVTFTQSNVEITNLYLKNAASKSNSAQVKFTQATNLRVRNRVELGKRAILNPDSQLVTIYIGGGTQARHFKFIPKGVESFANVYVDNGVIKTRNTLIPTATKMTGRFIADSILAYESKVRWNWSECLMQTPPPVAALAAKVTPPTPTKEDILPVVTEKEVGGLLLQLSPNPSKGRFSLSLITTNTTSDRLDIRITSQDGSLVLQKQMANFKGVYQEEIDMSGLSTGVYFVNVISGETMIHEKLILTK